MNKKPNRLQMGAINALGIPKYLDVIERSNPSIQSQDENFSLRENKVWYKGNTADIEWFYKTNFRSRLQNNFEFYRVVNGDIPRVHYPLASTISNAFGSLLFSNYPTFIIETGSQKRNAEYMKRLKHILDINDMLSLLQNAAQLQSYSGVVGLKLNYDPTLTDAPLITIYPKEDMEIHKRLGQTIYIDFFDYYQDGFKLVSRYGMGYISYRLYKGEDLVPLQSLEATQNLKDVAFYDEEGNILPMIFAETVQNKSNNRSDYDGLISSFQALDETFSSLVNYIRRTKPNIFISEDIAAKDSNGNPRPLNNFDNVITILDSTPEGQATEINRDVVNINIKGYRETFEAIREEILMKVGISPGTLGLPSGGARESSMALNIRERASMRSRNEKLAIWKEKISSFLFSTLLFDEIVNKADLAADGNYYLPTFKDFDIEVDFGSYIEETLTEKIEMYSKALREKVASVGFAITQIYGDKMSDTELLYLIIDTKKENKIELTQEELDFLEKQKESRTKFSILNFKEPV